MLPLSIPSIVALLVAYALPVHVAASGRDAAPLVQVDLYMETLCPFCAHFIKEELPKLFLNNISSIIDLSIVPWGNAHMTPDGPMCQHGPVECQMNRKFSCFSHFHSDQSLLLQYAACSEGHSALDIYKASNQCIHALGLDLTEIQECEDGLLGDDLQSEAFNNTASLAPPHLWVPWVVVNGQPIFDDLDHVQQYICTAYTGSRPEACAKDPTDPTMNAVHLMEQQQAAGASHLRAFTHDASSRAASITTDAREPCYRSD